eukprot:gnl/Chilomastix_caulleri/1112.p2 GENE.gnl/Chilomastix_caulleri/1112~~gnl/Chilomastix_caulleri/1112.p2  ORF type:complete len:150 (+),score=46.49 gnl/Chilomastix_caulleri/1112:532-981(+)
MSVLTVVVSLVVWGISVAYVCSYVKYSKVGGSGIFSIDSGKNPDSGGIVETRSVTDEKDSPHTTSTTALSDNERDDNSHGKGVNTNAVQRRSSIHSQIMVIVICLLVLGHSIRFFSPFLFNRVRWFALVAIPAAAASLTLVEELLGGAK